MSDTKLRDLERRWKETGTVEDDAAYLLERVRVGDLTRERLDLAAYCGHEGARKALDLAIVPDDLAGWLTGLEPFGRDAVVRSGIAFANSCLLSLWAQGPWGGDRSVGALVMALESEILCPCEACHEAVEFSVPAARHASVYASERTGYAGETCSSAPSWAAHAVCCLPGLRDEAFKLSDVLRLPIGLAIADDYLRELLTDELVPWALGRTDPIETRLIARRARS